MQVTETPRDAIRRIALELARKGESPTPKSVRNLLGKGSFSTIVDVLRGMEPEIRELLAERSFGSNSGQEVRVPNSTGATVSLPEEVLALFGSSWQLAVRYAEATSLSMAARQVLSQSIGESVHFSSLATLVAEAREAIAATRENAVRQDKELAGAATSLLVEVNRLTTEVADQREVVSRLIKESEVLRTEMRAREDLAYERVDELRKMFLVEIDRARQAVAASEQARGADRDAADRKIAQLHLELSRAQAHSESLAAELAAYRKLARGATSSSALLDDDDGPRDGDESAFEPR